MFLESKGKDDMNDTLITELEAACARAVIEIDAAPRAYGGWPLTENDRQVFKLGFIAGTRFGIDIAKRDIDRLGKPRVTG